MAVTGSITTRFIDEKGVDLGKTLIEKDYLISVYPNLLNQFDTPMLMTWGSNFLGQLGDNTNTNKSSPVQTVACGSNWKSVSAGYNCAAIKIDGTLWCQGDNAYGQLGDNTITKRSSPVQTVAFGTNWKQVSAGLNYHTAAIKNDGTLWGWGKNNLGQLGDNTASILHRSSPVQTVAFGTNWKQVSCGLIHTAAIKTDGTLWCWGRNAQGQLGDNTITDRSSPVQTITGGTNWKQVACGYKHTTATKTDGTLWSWGNNNNGQLGDNTTTSKSSPIQTITYNTNWKQVDCGQNFSLAYTSAIKNDGTLWTWGGNSYGQLGDNTTTNKSSPVQTVNGGTNWKQVDCGYKQMAAIKTDGTLWTWGDNSYGELGDNTRTSRSSPIQTILYGQNWKSVSCGRGFTAAIKDGDF
jgi:alpha-tubulin suppressor-like RCC1 family protein